MSAIRTPAAPDVPVREPATTIATGAEVSARAFARDLPKLLHTHAGQWVAYANGALVGFAERQTPLYHRCANELGFADEEFIVRFVEPDEGGTVEYSPR